MKKLSVLFAAVMLIATAAFALDPSQIQGKWVSTPQNMTMEEGMSASVKDEVKFEDATKVAIKSEANFTMDFAPMKIFIYAEIVGNGTYTCAGDSITINLDPATVKVNCTEDDIRITGVEDASQQTQMKQQMAQGMQGMLGQMAEEAASPDVLNNVMIVGKKMTCVNDGQMKTFKKK